MAKARAGAVPRGRRPDPEEPIMADTPTVPHTAPPTPDPAPGHAAHMPAPTAAALPADLEFPRYVFRAGGALRRVETVAETRTALAEGWSLAPLV